MIKALHKALSGLPVEGVLIADRQGKSVAGSTWHQTGARWVRLDWATEPTTLQQRDAQTIIDAFDFRERVAKSDAELEVEILAKSADDQNKLIRAALIEQLKKDPGFAKRHGVNIEGDKPDGT